MPVYLLRYPLLLGVLSLLCLSGRGRSVSHCSSIVLPVHGTIATITSGSAEDTQDLRLRICQPSPVRERVLCASSGSFAGIINSGV